MSFLKRYVKKENITIIEKRINKIENKLNKIQIVFSIFFIYIIICFYNYKYQNSLIL